MSPAHWLPKGRLPLHNHIVFGVSYVKANAERFGMGKGLPLGVWFEDVFLKEYNVYIECFDIWENPTTQTPGANAWLKMAEEKIIPLYRELCTFLKGNPLVSNADLVDMNLPKKKTGERRKAPVADAAPAFNITPIGSHRLRIYYHPSGSEYNAKPEGQHGAEIVWDFTTDIHMYPEDMSNSTFSTASPFTIQFDGADRGKMVSFAMRWENNRGIKGPWSYIQTATIP